MAYLRSRASGLLLLKSLPEPLDWFVCDSWLRVSGCGVCSRMLFAKLNKGPGELETAFNSLFEHTAKKMWALIILTIL